MFIECLNKGRACSSLIIGDFDKFEQSFEDFCIELKGLMEQKVECYIKSRHATEYAFVTASTNDNYDWVAKHLQQLGFYSTEATHNTKNDSIVQLHIIPVPKLMEALNGDAKSS